MSWKFVFNTSKLGARTLEQVADIAENVGYEFFVFNGDVYFVTNGQYYKTTIGLKDLF